MNARTHTRHAGFAEIKPKSWDELVSDTWARINDLKAGLAEVRASQQRIRDHAAAIEAAISKDLAA